MLSTIFPLQHSRGALECLQTPGLTVRHAMRLQSRREKRARFLLYMYIIFVYNWKSGHARVSARWYCRRCAATSNWLFPTVTLKI